MTDNLAPLHDSEAPIDRMTLRSRSPETPRPTAQSFGTIVVGVDGSPTSDRALAWSIAIAHAYKSNVHLVTALGPPAFDHGLSGHSAPVGGSLASWQDLMDEEHRAAGEILIEAKQRLKAEGVDATTKILIGSVAPRLAEFAEAKDADLIIVGGEVMSPLERLVLGSVTGRVRHESSCSVLVARDDPPTKHILMTTDGSAYSRSAVATGIRLAQSLGATAEVLHVVPPPDHGPASRSKTAYEEARDAIAERDATRAAAPGDESIQYEVAFGDPVETILEHADKGGHDLIVLGTRGLSGLRSRLAGSVSEPVTRKSPVSVLMYKEETP